MALTDIGGLLIVIFALFAAPLIAIMMMCVKNIAPRFYRHQQALISPIRERVRTRMYESPYWEQWVIFQVVLSAALMVHYGCQLYLAPLHGTFYNMSDPGFVGYIILGVMIAFVLADMLIGVARSESLLGFMFSPYTLIDICIVVPYIVKPGSPAWYFQVLRVSQVLRITRDLRLVRVTESEFRRQLMVVVLTTVNLLCVFSALIVVAENINDPPDLWYLHDSLWFVVVTAATVGYGDTVPHSGWGRALTIVLIGLCVVLIPLETGRLITTLQARNRYGGTFRRDAKRPFVVVIAGNLNVAGITDFFREFYHEGIQAGQERVDPKIVLLCSNAPSKEVEDVLHHPYYRQRVEFLQGTPLSRVDLQRAHLRQAEACFVIASQLERDSTLEDTRTILRCLAIKEYDPTKPTHAQILNKKNISHVVGTGVASVICKDDIKMAVLAQTCLCPGLSAMITNLVRSFSYSPDAYLDWRDDYSYGAAFQLRTLAFNKQLEGIAFPQAVWMLFEDTGALMIAVKHPEAMKMWVHPGTEYLIMPGDMAIVMCQNVEQVKDYFFAVNATFTSSYVEAADPMELAAVKANPQLAKRGGRLRAPSDTNVKRSVTPTGDKMSPSPVVGSTPPAAGEDNAAGAIPHMKSAPNVKAARQSLTLTIPEPREGPTELVSPGAPPVTAVPMTTSTGRILSFAEALQVTAATVLAASPETVAELPPPAPDMVDAPLSTSTPRAALSPTAAPAKLIDSKSGEGPPRQAWGDNRRSGPDFPAVTASDEHGAPIPAPLKQVEIMPIAAPSAAVAVPPRLRPSVHPVAGTTPASPPPKPRISVEIAVEPPTPAVGTGGHTTPNKFSELAGGTVTTPALMGRDTPATRDNSNAPLPSLSSPPGKAAPAAVAKTPDKVSSSSSDVKPTGSARKRFAEIAKNIPIPPPPPPPRLVYYVRQKPKKNAPPPPPPLPPPPLPPRNYFCALERVLHLPKGEKTAWHKLYNIRQTPRARSEIFSSGPFEDHIIVCGGYLSSALTSFFFPLRSTKNKSHPTIVLMHPLEPTRNLLVAMARFDDIYYVEGDHLDEVDLARVSVDSARAVVVLGSHNHRGEIDDEYMLDAEAIGAARGIELRANVTTITELAHGSNSKFIRYGIADVESSDEEDDAARRRTKSAPDYHFAPDFAAGRLYVASMLGALLCQLHYNPDVADVIQQLVRYSSRQNFQKSGDVYEIDVPMDYWGQPYRELVKYFILSLNLLPMALYREPSVQDGAAMHYVITNPAPDAPIRPRDRVILLAHEDPSDLLNQTSAMSTPRDELDRTM